MPDMELTQQEFDHWLKYVWKPGGYDMVQTGPGRWKATDKDGVEQNIVIIDAGGQASPSAGAPVLAQDQGALGQGGGKQAGAGLETEIIDGRKYIIFRDQFGNISGAKEVEGEKAPFSTPPLLDDETLASWRQAGFEPVFNVSTQQWIPKRAEAEPPLEWRNVVMQKLISPKPEDRKDAQRIWNFWNQMEPGAKVQLGLQLATAPGDYVTYWALTRGGAQTPNLEFSPGTRRMPLASFLTDFLRGQVPELFDLPVARDGKGQGLSNQQLQQMAEASAGPTQAEIAGGPGVVAEAAPSPATSAEPSGRLPSPLEPSKQGQALLQPAMSSQQSAFLEQPRGAREMIPVSAANMLPMAQGTTAGAQMSLPVGLAGLGGPEVNILGEHGPEFIVPARPHQPVGQIRLFPLSSGEFPVISGQERQSVIRDLPAFGNLSGIRQPRLLPSLGAPQFPSAQQLSGMLPTEQEAFQQQVALGGFPIQDYLYQLRQQTQGNMPARRQSLMLLPAFMSSLAG